MPVNPGHGGNIIERVTGIRVKLLLDYGFLGPFFFVSSGLLYVNSLIVPLESIPGLVLGTSTDECVSCLASKGL